MTPKFRGGSDDWLDDESEKSSAAGVANKKAPKKAKTLRPDEANATVAEVFPKRAAVRMDDGLETRLLCHYRRASVIGRDVGEHRERAPVAVGDRVKIERMQGNEGLIVGMCARRNHLARPAPDREETMLHVLVANLDRLVIVMSAQSPEFSPGIVDRFLVAAAAQKIPCLLAVTKLDLIGPEDSRLAWKTYAELGVDVVELSRKSDGRTYDGLEQLRQKINGQTVAFCGHSGVGKTSLLTQLLGHEAGAVGTVSDFTGKGRHTTTSAVLLEGAQGSSWMDTPGVREFGLHEISPERLKDYFPEFAGLSPLCVAPSCLHLDEAGCRARELPRYPSYRRILESLIEARKEAEGNRR